MSRITILVPTYNEEEALPATISALRTLDPPPHEVLLVDGGSTDRTVHIAKAAGLRTLISPRKGRGAQINLGVAEAAGEVVCVLHADSILPADAMTVIARTMADPRTALASFTPRIAGPQGTRWGSTLHNWLKTYYAPILTRPDLFVRGMRLLWGDHAMFFRKRDFTAIGGCDERVAVMEEVGLCVGFAQLGRVRMVRRWVWTSDRRIAAWGRWRANWIYFKVAMMWAVGARESLAKHYPDVR
ncbi:MAG: glycosyltransferase [Erythrobacter sp.]